MVDLRKKALARKKERDRNKKVGFKVLLQLLINVISGYF